MPWPYWLPEVRPQLIVRCDTELVPSVSQLLRLDETSTPNPLPPPFAAHGTWKSGRPAAPSRTFSFMGSRANSPADAFSHIASVTAVPDVVRCGWPTASAYCRTFDSRRAAKVTSRFGSTWICPTAGTLLEDDVSKARLNGEYQFGMNASVLLGCPGVGQPSLTRLRSGVTWPWPSQAATAPVPRSSWSEQRSTGWSAGIGTLISRRSPSLVRKEKHMNVPAGSTRTCAYQGAGSPAASTRPNNC